MILQTVELMPNQKAAIEEVAGRELQLQENMVLRRGAQSGANAQERREATEQMRYHLYLLDRSQRRMSIEDFMAALLDAASPEVSA